MLPAAQPCPRPALPAHPGEPKEHTVLDNELSLVQLERIPECLHSAQEPSQPLPRLGAKKILSSD